MTPAPEPPPPRSRVEPEMIVAIAAVVVGVCALGVSLFQAGIMRAQQREMSEQRRAEVWPHLEFGTSINETGYRLLAFNSGIGPARIRWLRLRHDGAAVATWSELVDRVPLAEPRYGFQHSYLGGRVLPAGQQIEALLVPPGPLADSLAAHTDRIAAEFCYCSVYDECWTFDLPFGGEPARTEAERCDPPDDAFEQ